jgi:aminoglycoside phosphotransferase (APT) family kinase protein
MEFTPRLPWADVPPFVVDGVQQLLGAKIVRVEALVGGFSPGAAVRAYLDDNSTVFIKTVGTSLNPMSVELYRREAQYTARLPETFPAPRLVGVFDQDDWIALIFDDVAGPMPSEPWRTDELTLVLDGVDAIAIAGSPSPFEAPSFSEQIGASSSWEGFRQITAEDRLIEGLDPWTADYLDQLVALESGWREATAGTTLMHGDIRRDNMLIAGERVMFVDWASCSIGAPWLDLALFLPSVTVGGGPQPATIWATRRVARTASEDQLCTLVTAILGYLTLSAMSPAPANMPTVRAYQAKTRDVTREWLQTLLGE